MSASSTAEMGVVVEVVLIIIDFLSSRGELEIWVFLSWLPLMSRCAAFSCPVTSEPTLMTIILFFLCCCLFF